MLLQDCFAAVSALPERRPAAESLITVRQICFSRALICATLPEPKTSHRWLSWAFSSEVRGAPLACFLICALQTATSAAPPPDGIAELGVVVVELLLVEELLGVELVLVVVVLVVVVLVVVVLVAALEEVLLEVVAAALVVLALLVALLVAVVVVLGLLPPQAATSAPLTTAPTSSRYSLRVIVHPSDLILGLRNPAGHRPRTAVTRSIRELLSATVNL